MQAAEARHALKSAEGRVEGMRGRNERHAAEVAKATRFDAGAELVTSTQAQTFSGGRLVVIYPRCKNDGHDCDHDARQQPYSDAELHAAGAEIAAAERRLKAAEKALATAEASSSFDVAEACREVGTRFAWWPLEVFADPRKWAYRGKPITAAELERLGPLELQRQLAAGSVVELLTS